MHAPSKMQNKPSLSPGLVRVFNIALFFLSISSFSYAQQPPPGGGRGGPPPEAFAACEKLVENNACTVETPRGELTGTCRQDRRSEALLCVPKNKPRKDNQDEEPSPDENQSYLPKPSKSKN